MASEQDEQKSVLPSPSGNLGRFGGGTSGVEVQAIGGGSAPVEGEAALTGWKRAVHELSGEVILGEWTEVPPSLEAIAPVLEILQRAKERGHLKLPDGRIFILFGFPSLHEANSRVLAVREAEPLAEIIVLHRYPVRTGIAADQGLVAPRLGALATAEKVTGRAPKEMDGTTLFAVQSDAVWLRRGDQAIRWDGKTERADGTINQVLASRLLDWSER